MSTNVDGYAFTKDYEIEMNKRKERYNAIKDLRSTIVTNSFPKYGHTDYTGTLQEDSGLTDLDILLLCDRGNTCFGGTVNRYGKNFTATVFTD